MWLTELGGKTHHLNQTERKESENCSLDKESYPQSYKIPFWFNHGSFHITTKNKTAPVKGIGRRTKNAVSNIA